MLCPYCIIPCTLCAVRTPSLPSPNQAVADAVIGCGCRHFPSLKSPWGSCNYAQPPFRGACRERDHPYVCVLHIKPVFLPIDIQHNQCPCRFFNPREIQVMWSQNYATEILRYAANRVDNAMPCHPTGYDRHGIYIL